MTESDAADVELPRGIALAWGVAATPQRGPKREMSVERIVDAAVVLADAQGLGAVSMAAVAASLGYTPMSLYRYVTAKDDLVLLMQEQATGAPPEVVNEAEGWRARLELLYGAQVQVYLAHPWLLDIPISGAPTTPNSAAWMDAGLAALADTTLTQNERLSVMLFVTGQARWCGAVMTAYARTAQVEGIDDAEITRREAALFEHLITSEEFPALREAIDDGVFLDASDPFAFGFARGLDGVAQYLATAPAERVDASAAWPVADDADIADDKRFREASKAVRDAEKALRDARKVARQTAKLARERKARHPSA